MVATLLQKTMLETSNHKRPPLPSSPGHVHLMGIGGTGMSALAGLFYARGVEVSGSDQAVYPPVSNVLGDLGIHVMEGYHEKNLHPKPDLVIVGNVIRRSNPEAMELERTGVPFASLPESLNQYFIKDKSCIVVAGTHGKTTVSSMTAWILHQAGFDPSFLIGGIANNFGSNYRLGSGSFFIIEGDEYDTAYFDKRPKLLHYYPSIGIITSCEFDHADIYDNLDTIKQQFVNFAHNISGEGRLIGHGDDIEVREIIKRSLVCAKTYGIKPDVHYQLSDFVDTGRGMQLAITKEGRVYHSGTLQLMGVHNLLNVVAAVAASEAVGIDLGTALSVLESFTGVARRQQVLGQKAGVIIIDDFAHHPSEVKATCAAVRSRFPNRRLVAVFEPRTNTSRRSVFQEAYESAFLSADLVVLREPIRRDQIAMSERFSSQKLAMKLIAAGKEACSFEDTEGVLGYLIESLRTGDAVLLMSNGSFDNLGLRLFNGLREETP